MPFRGSTTNQRRAQLAAIHVQAKRLRMDRETYEALLERISGQRSAAGLDFRQRAAVLDELHRLTGETARRMRQAVPPPGSPRGVREELSAMVAKLEAIAAELGLSWAYIDGMSKRMFHVDKAQWCTAEQLHKLVAALAIHQKRKRGTA